MFRLFRRRKDKPSLIYPAYQKAGRAIEKRQRKWAGYLNQKSERLQPRYIKLLLALFCLVFGGASLCIGINAFNRPVRKGWIDKISFPAHVISNDTLMSPHQLSLLSEKQLQNIERFKNYMDSLSHTKGGRVIYDSIIEKRPGLMDSVALIEIIYQKQLKSK